jgi:hypothetical protein
MRTRNLPPKGLEGMARSDFHELVSDAFKLKDERTAFGKLATTRLILEIAVDPSRDIRTTASFPLGL